jgi:ABC-2 type transport system ATP-binding protein
MHEQNIHRTKIWGGGGITATGLGKRYGDLWALRELDLHVPAGTVLGLLGHNGAGKTTAVRILTTLARPTTGAARVDGLDILADAAGVRSRIGLAGQAATVDELLSARANLHLVGRLYHMPRRVVRRRADELLERLGLSEHADRLVKTFSGGMRRRLDLAATLVATPPVLFLDEPTTGLDPASRNELWDLLGELVGRGMTLLLTTQYLEEADRLSHEVAIVDRGRIVAAGSPEELKESIGTDVVTVKVPSGDGHPARAAEVLGRLDGASEVRAVGDSVVIYIKDGSTAISPIVLRLSEASIPVQEVTLARPTLDDVFLRKTGYHIESETTAAAPAGTKSR